MRTSFAAASVLICLAAVACKKDEPPKTEAPPAAPPSASAASSAASTTAAAAGNKESAKEAAKEAAKERKAHARAVTVPFGQHPPKPEKVEPPKVPELPELAKQEKAPPPAVKVNDGEYACGAAHSGDHDYPTMCLEDKDHSKDERQVKALVPWSHFKGKTAPLPKIVDHREEKTEAEIRDQGSAGTCTTFGTSAAIDHAVTRWTGVPSHISTMELWGRYHQMDLGDALIASVGQKFAPEEAWPYDAKVAWPWRECKGATGKAEGPCGKPVDKAKLAELEKKATVIVEQVEWLPKDFEIARRKIAAGQDLAFAMKLPRHFKPVGKEGARYIPDYKDEGGGHAMAIAGYVLGEKGDNYFLIHNSWGEKWGDGGYAWIHEATLAKHMFNGFGVVDARPLSGEKAHREGKTCPKDQAPDSLTAACMATCKDGSPTHNGVCPEASDCPAGFVNLFGECIGAAPTDSGKDEKSNISWKCGPSGCAYTLPKALGKCKDEPCILSCPAPSFHAAKDAQGLTCVE